MLTLSDISSVLESWSFKNAKNRMFQYYKDPDGTNKNAYSFVITYDYMKADIYLLDCTELCKAIELFNIACNNSFNNEESYDESTDIKDIHYKEFDNSKYENQNTDNNKSLSTDEQQYIKSSNENKEDTADNKQQKNIKIKESHKLKRQDAQSMDKEWGFENTDKIDGTNHKLINETIIAKELGDEELNKVINEPPVSTFENSSVKLDDESDIEFDPFENYDKNNKIDQDNDSNVSNETLEYLNKKVNMLTDRIDHVHTIAVSNSGNISYLMHGYDHLKEDVYKKLMDDEMFIKEFINLLDNKVLVDTYKSLSDESKEYFKNIISLEKFQELIVNDN